MSARGYQQRPDESDEERMDRVRGAFEGVRRCGKGWDVKCPVGLPAHPNGDRNNSLTIGWGTAGRIVLQCKAGCETAHVLKAVGLRWSDLFRPGERQSSGRARSDKTARKPSPSPAGPERPARDWEATQKKLLGADHVMHWRYELRKSLGGGITLDATGQFGVGHRAGFQIDSRTYPPVWTAPSRDGEEKIVGIVTRTHEGDKGCYGGSQHSVLVARDWKERAARVDAVYIVEGLSDCLVLWTHGLLPFGMPSNFSRPACEHLAKLLMKILETHPHLNVIVVGEREKSGAGVTGAKKTTALLTELLKRRVRWCLPPGGAKDSRVWFSEHLGDGGSDILAWDFEAGLHWPDAENGEAGEEADGTAGAEAEGDTSEGDGEAGAQNLSLKYNVEVKESGGTQEIGFALYEEVKRLTGYRSLPPARACPAACRPALRHREECYRSLVLSIPCRRWTCVVCSQRLKYHRALHHGGIFLRENRPVHVTSIPADAWKATGVRLSRAKASYLRIESSPGCYTLFSSAPVSDEPPLSPADACSRLGETLRHLVPRTQPVRGKPVAISSRSWCIAKAKKESKREWERMGFVRVLDPDPIVTYLRSKGAEPDVEIDPDANVYEWKIYWEAPDIWSPQETEDVLRSVCLLAGRLRDSA